jgi:hypothetical protein
MARPNIGSFSPHLVAHPADFEPSEELVGSPVKLQASNALGVFVSTGLKDVFNRIGIKPSRWF